MHIEIAGRCVFIRCQPKKNNRFPRKSTTGSHGWSVSFFVSHISFTRGGSKRYLFVFLSQGFVCLYGSFSLAIYPFLIVLCFFLSFPAGLSLFFCSLKIESNRRTEMSFWMYIAIVPVGCCFLFRHAITILLPFQPSFLSIGSRFWLYPSVKLRPCDPAQKQPRNFPADEIVNSEMIKDIFYNCI